MRISLFSILFASIVFTIGCQQQNNAGALFPVIDKKDAVASVNGKYISNATFEMVLKEAQQNSRGQKIPDTQLLQKLIDMELLVQQAEQKKLYDNPELVQRLTMVKKGLLSQAAMQDFIQTNPVTDADIKAEYDKQISTTGGSEFKARHILVKTEPEAIAIITELDNGGDFAAIAMTKSVGPTGKRGGDLGWFPPTQMVPPFSEAVIALENGKYTATPVQTKFGWHVIYRDDSRSMTPPPLESVKEQIRPMLQRQKIQDYLATLRSQAKIENLIPVKTEPSSPASEIKSVDATIPPENMETENSVAPSKPEPVTAKEITEQ